MTYFNHSSQLYTDDFQSTFFIKKYDQLTNRFDFQTNSQIKGGEEEGNNTI